MIPCIPGHIRARTFGVHSSCKSGQVTGPSGEEVRDETHLRSCSFCFLVVCIVCCIRTECCPTCSHQGEVRRSLTNQTQRSGGRYSAAEPRRNMQGSRGIRGCEGK